MKITEEQIQFLSTVLLKVTTEDSVKLAYGKLRRIEIKLAIEDGNDIENYRTEWIRKTQGKMVEVLLKSAIDFNAIYKHDKISVADMMDVIANVYAQYKRISEKLFNLKSSLKT